MIMLKGKQRCIYCGRFLYNSELSLPFEIVSTGAFIVKMEIELNCGHCHRSHTYSIVHDCQPIRVDS